VDPAASNIEFQIALPTNWNSKALMLGGGGFDGVIPPVAEGYYLYPPSAAAPLARGYAVFASDSGHQNETPKSRASMFDGVFFGNEEAYRNYIGDALKKTHDVALAVIESAYGRRPSKSYFRGGSKGGGEAIMAIARWPADWDGAFAWFPARDYVMDMLGFLATTQSLAAPGAYLNLAKRGVLYRAALETCDGLDGVRDGIISNEKGCRAKFDPATATLNGVPLRCPGGRDTGDTCLSDANITAARKIEGSVTFGFMPGGARVFPGFNMLTADLGASGQSPLNQVIAFQTVGTTPPSFPTAEGNAISVEFTDRFFRFAVTNNKAFNHLNVNLADPGPLVARLQELAKLDQVDGDLTGFTNRKGRLIIVHGTDDMLISPRATEQYYEGLRAKMGGGTVDRFLRFYEVPGFGHGSSTVFNARLDDLSMLEAWVERNEDPAQSQVVMDAALAGRTRPLCLYPNWPKYKGSGDPNVSSSFVCAAH
jgi:feruloyl esterase